MRSFTLTVAEVCWGPGGPGSNTELNKDGAAKGHSRTNVTPKKNRKPAFWTFFWFFRKYLGKSIIFYFSDSSFRNKSITQKLDGNAKIIWIRKKTKKSPKNISGSWPNQFIILAFCFPLERIFFLFYALLPRLLVSSSLLLILFSCVRDSWHLRLPSFILMFFFLKDFYFDVWCIGFTYCACGSTNRSLKSVIQKPLKQQKFVIARIESANAEKELRAWMMAILKNFFTESLTLVT